MILVAVGCSDSVAPPSRSAIDVPPEFIRALSSGPLVFVLSHVERQASSPIILFDHVCQGTRYTHTVSDTIVLSADGRARRAFVLESLKNGVASSTSYLAFSGRWGSYPRRDGYYFSDGPSILLSLSPIEGQRGTSYEMAFRLRGAEQVSTLSGLGGSCPGSPSDGREAEFIYSRQ